MSEHDYLSVSIWISKQVAEDLEQWFVDAAPEHAELAEAVAEGYLIFRRRAVVRLPEDPDILRCFLQVARSLSYSGSRYQRKKDFPAWRSTVVQVMRAIENAKKSPLERLAMAVDGD